MSDYQRSIRPWVEATINEASDLHLEDGIYGADGVVDKISHTVYSLRDRQVRKWLKSQGWSSPEEKAELIEVMEELVEVWADSVDYSQPDEYNRYLKIIAKAKGGQDEID